MRLERVRKLTCRRFGIVAFRQQYGKNRKRNGTQSSCEAEQQGIFLSISIEIADAMIIAQCRLRSISRVAAHSITSCARAPQTAAIESKDMLKGSERRHVLAGDLYRQEAEAGAYRR